MQHTKTLSAFVVPGLTAAIVSGMMTAAGLSFAQDVMPSDGTWHQPTDTMQFRPVESGQMPTQMDGGMQGGLFRGSDFEMHREMNGGSSMNMNPGFHMNMAPKDGQGNFGAPPSSFGQGMQMHQDPDRSMMKGEMKKQVEKQIKKMEKMKGKVEKQFAKQIARMQKKCDRALQKMQSRLAKLEEDDRADLQEEIDDMKSGCADAALDMNDRKEEQLEEIDFRIEDLQDQLAEMESEDMDE